MYEWGWVTVYIMTISRCLGAAFGKFLLNYEPTGLIKLNMVDAHEICRMCSSGMKIGTIISSETFVTAHGAMTKKTKTYILNSTRTSDIRYTRLLICFG